MNPAIDLTHPQHVHVVAVGGVAMNLIATVLLRMGHTVSGSDLVDSPPLARLRAEGVTARAGHAAENVAGADVVVVSTAVP